MFANISAMFAVPMIVLSAVTVSGSQPVRVVIGDCASAGYEVVIDFRAGDAGFSSKRARSSAALASG